MSKRANATNKRRTLCVFPAYTPSFGTFSHACKLLGVVRAFMPPQGLLVIAAYLPEDWEVRFIDENMARATPSDFAWADAVFVSGMHVQAPQIARHRAPAPAPPAKSTALGGPSVSALPEMYPDFDYLHVGELGDATDRLIARARREHRAAAGAGRASTTSERLPLADFPVPAYELSTLERYFIGSAAVFERLPLSLRVLRHPGALRPPAAPEDAGAGDGRARRDAAQPAIRRRLLRRRQFHRQPKAARELLPHLVAWQKQRGYPLEFACEATLNIAKQPEILELMREASSPRSSSASRRPTRARSSACEGAQRRRCPCSRRSRRSTAMGSRSSPASSSGSTPTRRRPTEPTHRLHRAVEDPDADDQPPAGAAEDAALGPPRRRRPASIDDAEREFERRASSGPTTTSSRSWRRCIGEAYTPERVYPPLPLERRAHLSEPHQARFAHSGDVAERFARPRHPRPHPPPRRRACTLPRDFWRHVGPLLKAGKIEEAIHLGVVAHHLITFAREAAAGRQNASFYSERQRELAPAA